MSVSKSNNAEIRFGPFRLDMADERLWGPQGAVRLGNKAYRVLLELIQQQGRLITKDMLFSSVWDGTVVSESALTSVIKELRRALGDDTKTPRYIESVYGRGYRFVADVSTAPPTAEREAEPRPATGAASIGEPPLLYVPAFEDGTIREAHPHLATVLREEILFALSRFRDIRLVSGGETGAAGSVGRYGPRDYQLAVRLVHDGIALKTFARLSRLSTQAIIWADSIALAGESMAPRVEELVRRIAAAALPRLQDDLLRDLPQEARDAYDIYFLNRLRTRSVSTLEEARQLAASWEHLIERHPSFAAAYPQLTRLYNTDFCYTGLGTTGPDERSRAYRLAHQAIAIDPTESHLHTVKGWAHLWAGETPLAREHFEGALRLNPYNQGRLSEAAAAFMFLGDLDRAGDLLDRCRNLTPFATEAPHEDEGLYHLLRKEFDRAAERLALVAPRRVSSELYGLLAAAGSGAADLPERARAWRGSIARHWAAPEPLDEERLIAWVLYHHPFQQAEVKDWILDLLRPALRLAEEGHSHAAPQAHARTKTISLPAGAAG